MLCSGVPLLDDDPDEVVKALIRNTNGRVSLKRKIYKFGLWINQTINIHKMESCGDLMAKLRVPPPAPFLSKSDILLPPLFI